MKLILIPLTVMFILTMISMTGMSSGFIGTMTVSSDPINEVYTDSGGHAILYVRNLTEVGEKGRIAQGFEISDIVTHPAGWACWDNETIPIGNVLWQMYYENGEPLSYDDVGKSQNVGVSTNGISVGSSLGFIALLIGIMALSIIVGMRILGSGTSETSVSAVVKGSSYLALWGSMSITSLALITSMPIIGPILYLGLTLMFVIGVVNSFGHPSGDF